MSGGLTEADALRAVYRLTGHGHKERLHAVWRSPEGEMKVAEVLPTPEGAEFVRRTGARVFREHVIIRNTPEPDFERLVRDASDDAAEGFIA